jgi:hypothetical protein
VVGFCVCDFGLAIVRLGRRLGEGGWVFAFDRLLGEDVMSHQFHCLREFFD